MLDCNAKSCRTYHLIDWVFRHDLLCVIAYGLLHESTRSCETCLSQMEMGALCCGVQVLAGVRILFSRVIPLEQKPESHALWRLALAFGALCFTHMDAGITHVITNTVGTEKVTINRVITAFTQLRFDAIASSFPDVICSSWPMPPVLVPDT